MKLDILAVGVHPDDVELSCSGVLLQQISMGKKAGILDLTRGELGTRGTPEIRMKEAEASRKILGVSVRDNLGFKDSFFTIDMEHTIEIVKIIRKYRPEILLANATEDRHPDHGRASTLVTEAAFYSGLAKIETQLGDGKPQEAWRPKHIYHYIQDKYIKPTFVIDITPFMEKKMESIRAFSSQFYNPDSTEPETYISTPAFLEGVYARAMGMGKLINTKFGEGFTCDRSIGLADISSVI